MILTPFISAWWISWWPVAANSLLAVGFPPSVDILIDCVAIILKTIMIQALKRAKLCLRTTMPQKIGGLTCTSTILSNVSFMFVSFQHPGDCSTETWPNCHSWPQWATTSTRMTTGQRRMKKKRKTRKMMSTSRRRKKTEMISMRKKKQTTAQDQRLSKAMMAKGRSTEKETTMVKGRKKMSKATMMANGRDEERITEMPVEMATFKHREEHKETTAKCSEMAEGIIMAKHRKVQEEMVMANGREMQEEITAKGREVQEEMATVKGRGGDSLMMMAAQRREVDSLTMMVQGSKMNGLMMMAQHREMYNSTTMARRKKSNWASLNAGEG
mmetsp:Transcript_23416/g.65149  ORF Transcript_23416/g.65149 Transcript_23416/m.65149 type:complete len:328 (-) Transcript_23416:182-1165(-)